jgi:hypothetical protein
MDGLQATNVLPVPGCSFEPINLSYDLHSRLSVGQFLASANRLQ